MIAAKTYGEGNRHGLPADWLARTERVKRPEDAPWADLFFDDQKAVDSYLAERKAAYQAAIDARPKPPAPPPSLEEQVQSLEARVTALEQGR